MKAFYPAIAVLLLIISVSLTSTAQEAGYTTASGMTIGFGPGGSYQVSDIRNSTGAGFDFNLGSYLYKRQGAALAVDWKFRFLAGENRAHDDRINPGNSAWQFCLVTPGGTYNRDNLSNSNFMYSGPATSLYIMPIVGRGTATVNGKPYEVRSGQYYLFTGNMSVTVNTRNPGSMGQWSVIINTHRLRAEGTGDQRVRAKVKAEIAGKEKNRVTASTDTGVYYG